MSCPNCRTLSCYICRQVIKGYDHFSNQVSSVYLVLLSTFLRLFSFVAYFFFFCFHAHIILDCHLTNFINSCPFSSNDFPPSLITLCHTHIIPPMMLFVNDLTSFTSFFPLLSIITHENFQQPGRPSTSADAKKCILWDAVEERHAQEVCF
jgi:hypothetical protein